jgi:hypothetical protein
MKRDKDKDVTKELWFLVMAAVLGVLLDILMVWLGYSVIREWFDLPALSYWQCMLVVVTVRFLVGRMGK